MVGWWPSLLKTGDWMIGCWKIVAIGSMSSEDRSKQVDGIHPLYSDSLYPCCNQPITSLATISLLLSQPTGRSKDPHQYWCCCIVPLSWFSWPPMLMNPCSMFRSFLCHDHVLLHLHFTIMMIQLTVSPTLVPLLTHSLLLSIFSYWSVHWPYP